MKDRFEIACDHRCSLGEGTLWDAGGQQIYWIDIARGEIHRKSSGKGMETCKLDQAIGSVAFRDQGGLIGALKNGIYFIDFDLKTLQQVADPEADFPHNRFNDGKCDPQGRFWAGTMNLDEKSPTGNLYQLDSNLTISRKISGTTISNGMAWNGRGDLFYFIDSPTFSVQAFDFEAATGAISAPRKVIQIPREMGYPDGMTIDQDDNLWIAFFNGWGVSQWDPRTGKQLQKIRIPVSQVSCCTFGGFGLKDLYVSTASINLGVAELREQPLSGSLFVIPDCGARGRAPVKFGG